MSASTDAVVDRLRRAGCVFAEDEARLLMSAARDADELAAMVEQRAGGLPLEYVTGWSEFCGIRVEVLRGVFVPRHRTEFLVAQAAALMSAGAVVVDLCCGSGAVGAALADAVPGIELHAADIDGVAVECARRNLVRAEGRVYLGDLYDALPGGLRGHVGILVANVPYVPTADIALLPREARIYEPRATLDGGEDGLDVVRRLARSATEWLRAGGHLLVETSDRQASTAVDIMAAAGLRTRVAVDDDLEATVVVGTAPPAIRPGRRLRPSPPAATASRSPRRPGAQAR